MNSKETNLRKNMLANLHSLEDGINLLREYYPSEEYDAAKTKMESLQECFKPVVPDSLYCFAHEFPFESCPPGGFCLFCNNMLREGQERLCPKREESLG